MADDGERAPRPVLFEYWVAQNDTLVFIGRADLGQPEVVRVPVGAADLADAAARALAGRPRTAELQPLLGALVAPISTWADPGDVVWLVPHNVLHRVPLHALELPGGQVLAERNPVVYTPSASVMTYVRARTRRSMRRVMVYADSRSDLPLFHAEVEGLAVRQIFGRDVTVYMGDEVTRASVITGLTSKADIVHVACHGLFDPADPLRSGFLLSQNGDGGSPERFAAEDFTRLTCQASLVVLSACESGITRRGLGDELAGLTRAIIYSGAASLVVSLWSVDEISTSILMRRFYQGLVGGESKVLALQRAQVAVRDMTLAQVTSYCEALRPQQHGKGGRLIDLDLANLAYRAGDFAKALAGYEKLRATADLTEAERTGLTAAITRCRRAVPLGHMPDYGARPFGDAYYWAPFVLVGDWR